MKRNTKVVILGVIGIIIITIILYILASDNKNTVELTKEVITLKFEATNIFLVPINDGYILIDNAYAKEYDHFLKYLKSKNIVVTDIKYVLLTHHHDDHVGFLNQLVAENENIIIVLTQETSDLLGKGNNNIQNGGGIVNSMIYSLFRIKQIVTPGWDLSFPPYLVRKNDIIISDNNFDLSSILGINLIAFHTPGHTSDSTTFIYNGEIAFCGDMTSNFLNWAGAKYLTLFNEDITLVYKSWELLIDKKVKSIATSHGKPFHINNLKKYIFTNSQDNIVKFF